MKESLPSVMQFRVILAVFQMHKTIHVSGLIACKNHAMLFCVLSVRLHNRTALKHSQIIREHYSLREVPEDVIVMTLRHFGA